MPLRPCLGCNRLTTRTRCASCAQSAGRNPNTGKRVVTYTEKRRRAHAVATHRAQHGNVCPGWKREPHDATDLTADHVHPVGAGGPEAGRLEVLCRVCNGKKRASW